jgi:hypothetical protein
MTSESPTLRGRDIFAQPSSSPLHDRASAGSAIDVAVDGRAKTDLGDAMALPALFASEDRSAAPSVDHDMGRDADKTPVRHLPSSEPVAMPTRKPPHQDGAPDNLRASAVLPSWSPAELELHRQVEQLQATLKMERRVVEQQRRQIASDKKALQEADSERQELRTRLGNTLQAIAAERALQGLRAEEMGRQAIAAEEAQQGLHTRLDEQRRRTDAAETAKAELAQEYALLRRKFEDVRALLG